MLINSHNNMENLLDDQNQIHKMYVYTHVVLHGHNSKYMYLCFNGKFDLINFHFQLNHSFIYSLRH